MPNKSKDKGARFERQIVHMAETLGLKAYRYPTSRSPVSDLYDVAVAGRQVQCKKEASGFKRLRKWMQGVDAVIVGSDYETPLVILRVEDWLKLL